MSSPEQYFYRHVWLPCALPSPCLVWELIADELKSRALPWFLKLFVFGFIQMFSAFAFFGLDMILFDPRWFV